MNASSMPTDTESESLIAQSVARLFAEQVDKHQRERAERGEFPSDLWQMTVDNGFAAALTAEASGGIGERWSAVFPIFRGIGYWQVPLPLAETMVGGLLLSMAGLPVPQGPLALIEQAHVPGLASNGEGAALRLQGVAHRVAWARHCTHSVISLNAGQIALVDLRQGTGVSLTEGRNIAGLPADSIAFNAARCEAIGTNATPGLDQPVWAMGALARSIMMVGALDWLLEQSVQYANDRIQFGKPIGRNQAIQHPLAMMAGEISAAKVAALVAAADAPSSGVTDTGRSLFSIAVAKVRAGECAGSGAAIAHQVHGAIGFTHEHALHFATRRLWCWREDFGADAWWAEVLGRAAIAAGSQGLWPAITRRSF